MSEKILEILAQNGVIGLLAALEALIIRQFWTTIKEEREANKREIRELNEAYKAELKATAQDLLKVTNKVYETVNKLHELGEWAQNQKMPAE
jgi:hypothetical protein